MAGATMTESVYDAVEDENNRDNEQVKLTVVAGLSNVTLLNKNTPKASSKVNGRLQSITCV
jgi:hypothetical protein